MKLVWESAVRKFLYLGCRIKDIVELVFNTIREPYHSFSLPSSFAKLLATPREKLLKYVRPRVLITVFRAQGHIMHPARPNNT